MKKRNIEKDMELLDKTLESFNETLDRSIIKIGGTLQEKVKYPLFVEGSECLVHIDDGVYLDTVRTVGTHIIGLSSGDVVYRKTVQQPLESESSVEVYKLLKEAKERYPIGSYISGSVVRIGTEFRIMSWLDEDGYRICYDNAQLYHLGLWSDVYEPREAETFLDRIIKRLP